MADKESKDDAKQEGNTPGKPDADDVKLPPATVHRVSHSPLTKADK